MATTQDEQAYKRLRVLNLGWIAVGIVVFALAPYDYELPRRVDAALLRALARSRKWFEESCFRPSALARRHRAAREHHTLLCRGSLAPGFRSTHNRRSDLPGTTARRTEYRDLAQPDRSAA